MEIVKRSPTAKKVVWEIPIEPVEYDVKPLQGELCTFDTETDPFDVGRIVRPFTCHFHNIAEQYNVSFWGDDCIDQFFEWLAVYGENRSLIIMCHNWGNFDFYFCTKYMDAGQKPFIINGRVVRCHMQGQEFRDSYVNIPVALSVYDKMKIDYALFEKWPISCIKTKRETVVRELYKPEILRYQERDCTSLGELVSSWFAMFGDKMTMASAALSMLRSYHGFENISERIDTELREYYFGGRTQAFATGVMKGNFKIYDVNSSYPDAMRRVEHPISDTPCYEPKITKRTVFAKIRAWSLGALPVRKKDGSLDFPIGTFDFFACIHEINAGIETGSLRIIKVYHSIYFDKMASFDSFIDDFYKRRLEASESGDEIRKLFYKLVMNSSYGKFAQDPRKYENFLYDPDDIPTPLMCEPCSALIQSGIKEEEAKAICEECSSGNYSAFGWYLHTERDGKCIYAQPQRVTGRGFFNVATAASITSAARATLLRGIKAAKRPIYCDTDSIICEELTEKPGIKIDAKALGAWDLEATGDAIGIAGKKLYTVLTCDLAYAEKMALKRGEILDPIVIPNDDRIFYEVKKASKGVRLTASEIARVCLGEVIEYSNPVPKFSMGSGGSKSVEYDGFVSADFITRSIRRTGDG